MYYRKYKSKKNGNENNQSIFQICSEGKKAGKGMNENRKRLGSLSLLLLILYGCVVILSYSATGLDEWMAIAHIAIT